AATDATEAATETELFLGNSNRRFSGVTSTMLQTMALQTHQMKLRVLGRHHLPDESLAIGFLELAGMSKRLLPNGKYRIFHARRNDEMIQALILKHLLGAKIRIVFTSTAQRHHSSFTRWLMTKMDAVISTCDAAAAYLERKPDIIIPHGVNPNTYLPAPDRRAAWQATGLPGDYGIGIFGRVRKQKGVALFVNACIEQLPNHPAFTGVIVGAITADNQGFVDEQKKKISAAGLNTRIVFIGEQPFERVPELIRAMSLVAALSYKEGFGLTVLEAMSSACAVLATQAGAWPEIVVPEVTGKIVPAGDQDAITAELGKLLTDPAQLTEMGAAGRELVLEKYKLQHESDALCQFYRSLQ
ncbi:MAG: glycosyltransferase family 4 protein, partial [Burkholderiaceae bacterium]